MKHLLIILISLLFFSFLISCDKNNETQVIGDNHKGETLYRWDEYPDWKWKRFGEKEFQSFYNGDVKGGVPNGLGLMISPKGDKYEGEWMNGQKNGQGTSTWNDGTRYVGEYKDNNKNGQGSYTWSRGKYVGEWKDGDSNGQGTKTWSSGNKYVGSWKDGKQNGHGTMTFPDGSKYDGEYKDDLRWNGTSYDKDGTIKWKFVNGEPIK